MLSSSKKPSENQAALGKALGETIAQELGDFIEPLLEHDKLVATQTLCHQVLDRKDLNFQTRGGEALVKQKPVLEDREATDVYSTESCHAL